MHQEKLLKVDIILINGYYVYFFICILQLSNDYNAGMEVRYSVIAAESMIQLGLLRINRTFLCDSRISIASEPVLVKTARYRYVTF